jgi:hypothetical protein
MPDPAGLKRVFNKYQAGIYRTWSFRTGAGSWLFMNMAAAKLEHGCLADTQYPDIELKRLARQLMIGIEDHLFLVETEHGSQSGPLPPHDVKPVSHLQFVIAEVCTRQ